MKVGTLFVLCIILCLGSSKVQALNVELTNEVKQVIIEDEFLFLKKQEKKQSLELVKNHNEWFQSNDGLYYFSGGDQYLWGKFTVNNNSTGYWLVEFTDHRTDEIEFYYPDGSFVSSGDQKPFSNRLFEHKNFAFELPSGQSYSTYYFCIKSEDKIGVRIKLRRIDDFVAYSLKEYLCLGLFYGFLIIIVVLNCITYLKLKQLRYAFYSLHVTALGLFSACQDGFFFQYLWPNAKNANHAFEYFMYLYVVFELLYAIAFFNLKVKEPRMFKLVLVLIGLRSLYFVYEIIFGFDGLPIGLDSFHLIFVLGIGLFMLFRRGYEPAKYFVVGFVFILMGYIVYSLVYLGVIPVNFIMVYAIQIGAVVEFCVLTLAFADQVRYHREKRIMAQQNMIISLKETTLRQQNINKELEVKVIERTLEVTSQNEALISKNQELELLQEKLWKMNAEMDKLNWRLSKDVETTTEKQIHGEIVNFEVFQKIYPSEFSVLKLLHGLKKEKPFRCKSCKNSRCKTDDKKFLRICSKCGYRESASANSLLHGVRINKTVALYIVYRFCLVPKGSVKDLSKELKLRLSSIYNVRKKVLDSTGSEMKKDWTSQICN